MIKRFLQKRIDKIIEEAHIEAHKIIAGAKVERLILLSESALLKEIQKEADKIKQQTIEECQEMKRKAKEEVAEILNQNEQI